MYSFSASKKAFLFLFGTGLFVALLCGNTHSADDGIQRLLLAYPDHLCGAEGNTILWCDGETMPYDDGKGPKTHRQKLEDADLQEQMEQIYPRGTGFPVPPTTDFEPGRIRNERFFKKMYGDSAERVRKNLAPVNWLPASGGKRLYMTTVNRVNEHLQAVSNELDQLPAPLKRFVDNPAGSFNWRVIARERRLSPHSFGIAVDINAASGDYWLWNSGTEREPRTYRNRVPIEIVWIFEKHGFIWGGKWYHFDTLHFEYRPELLLDAGKINPFDK